jgi:hypothetical protein
LASSAIFAGLSGFKFGPRYARFLEVHGIDLVIEADLQRILSINEGILK